MTLLELLVEELPGRGGWPNWGILAVQDVDKWICFSTLPEVEINGGEWTNNGGEWVSCIKNCEHLAEDYSKAIITREQYEAALAASKPEWDGVGLPPVGCRVEYTCKQPDLGHPAIEAGKWYGGTIIAYYDECVWTSDNGIRHLSNTIFRPMRSEEGKKRYAAIEALFEILDAGVSTSQDSIDIYEAIAAGKIPHIRID